MVSNLDRYKKDLDRLIENGVQLLHSLQKEYPFDKYKLKNRIDIDNLPDFKVEYQSWYSESLRVIQQLLPNRENDFLTFYKRPKNEPVITTENYKIETYLAGLQIKNNPYVTREMIPRLTDGTPSAEEIIRIIPQFQQQLGILKSVQKRFESSLFDIKQLLQADLFDSELDASKELNKKGFVRGAGAIAGVVLEGHLKDVCNNHKIQVKKKNPTINDLNQLLKDNEVIETADWRKIQRLTDLRNLCDHRKESEPTTGKVSELIEGVEKVIKTLS